MPIHAEYKALSVAFAYAITRFDGRFCAKMIQSGMPPVRTALNSRSNGIYSSCFYGGVSMKKLSLVTLYIVSIIISAAISSYITSRSQIPFKNQIPVINKTIYEGEAMLWFNHLLQFREIETNLSKGCTAEALEATRIAIDQEMLLLSKFHKVSGDASVNKYISDRDPKLLSQLDSFESKYGGSWTIPQCSE